VAVVIGGVAVICDRVEIFLYFFLCDAGGSSVHIRSGQLVAVAGWQ
jgi:hypothetical protein